jgi:hypothetical protein
VAEKRCTTGRGDSAVKRSRFLLLFVFIHRERARVVANDGHVWYNSGESRRMSSKGKSFGGKAVMAEFCGKGAIGEGQIYPIYTKS